MKMMSKLRSLLLVHGLALACALPVGTANAVDRAVSAHPISFEENLGQWPEPALFAARQPGVLVMVTGSGAVLAARDRSPAPGETIRLRWLGASSALEAHGEGLLAGVRHYLRGADPDRWQLNVASFERIRQPDVYPGIDALFHDGGSLVEIDFEVRPGADPSDIRIAIEGQSGGVHLHEDGGLQLGDAADSIRLSPPVLYQRSGGHREVVLGRYRIEADSSVSFEVGEYDPTRTLVIDPLVLGSSSLLGGSAFDRGEDMTVGPDGSIYVTGETRSFDFMGSSVPAAGSDAFVTKITPDGRSVVYTAILGGSGFEGGLGVDADAAGNAYVFGNTESTDFPTMGAFQDSLNGASDAFVVKLGPSGAMVYGTYYGGADQDGQFDGGLSLHPSGDVYITGRTESAAGVPLVNAYQATCTMAPCAFVAGFDTSLSGPSSLIYGSFVGGNEEEAGLALDIDAAGNLYVFGFTSSDTGLIDVTQGFQTSTGDVLQRDHFLVKLDPVLSGSAQRVYSTYIGGTDDEPEGGDIVARNGIAWVVGETASTAATFPIKNAIQPVKGTGSDGYALRVDTTKTGAASQDWTTFVGGNGSDLGQGVAVDGGLNVWIGLSSDSTDLPILSPLPQFPAASSSAALIQLSADGQGRWQSTPIASAYKLDVDASDRLHVMGTANGSVPLIHGLRPGVRGNAEVFLARIETAIDRGLSLEVTDTRDPSARNQTFAFQYLIRNQGDQNATGLTLVSDFPAGLSALGTTAGCTLPGVQMSCMLDELAIGLDVPVFLRASASSDGFYGVSGTTDSNEVDPLTTDNTESETAQVAVNGADAGSLRCSDFDAVGHRFDIGAFCLDTVRGVLGTANGSLDDAVNLMTFDATSEPLFIVDILGQGEVAFGYVERNSWTPVSGDGIDLPGHDGNNPVDRVFAVVDALGLVELWTAADNVSGRRVASGALDLSQACALSLSIDKVLSMASVLCDGIVIAAGDPFTNDPADADPALVGDDRVITIGYGTDFRGAATINDEALGCPELVITDRTLGTPQTLSGCQKLVAGPNLTITSDVDLRARSTVAFRGRVVVGKNASVSVQTGAPFGR